MKKLMILPALALGMAAIAAPASADEVSKVQVSIADLDLASAKDREILERRLRYAANQACEHTKGRRNATDIAKQRECLNVAHASYREQMHVALGETGDRRVSLLTR